MRERTTPSLHIVIRGADLRLCRVWVTIWQGMTRKRVHEVTETKRRIDVDAGEREAWAVRLDLDQDDMDILHAGRAIVQANVMDTNGFRACTNEATRRIDRNYIDERLQ